MNSLINFATLTDLLRLARPLQFWEAAVNEGETWVGPGLDSMPLLSKSMTTALAILQYQIASYNKPIQQKNLGKQVAKNDSKAHSVQKEEKIEQKYISPNMAWTSGLKRHSQALTMWPINASLDNVDKFNSRMIPAKVAH